MKTPLLIVSFLCLRLAVVAQIPPPQFEWARSMGGWQDDDLADLVVAEDGSVYVTGSFKDFICFDTLCFPAASPDNSDIFLAKYDSVGVLQWAKAWGGRGIDQGQKLFLNKEDYLYFAGNFTDTIQINGQTFKSYDKGFNPWEHSDILLLKLSPEGEIVQSFHAGGTSRDEVSSIEVDLSNRVYISGQFYSDSLRLDENVTLLKGSGIGSMFWAHFDAEGLVTNYHVFSSSGSTIPIIQQMSISKSYLFMIGAFEDSFIVDGNLLTTDQTVNYFLMKWDTEGRYIWSELFKGSDIWDMTLDERGNIYFTGSMRDSVLFDTLFVNLGRAKYLARYSSEGRVQWVKKPVNGFFNNLSLFYNRGQLYLAGSFSHTITIGDSTFTSPREEQLLIARYDTTGNLIWVRAIKNISDHRLLQIEGNSKGDVTLAGGYNYNGLFFDSTLVLNVFPAYMDVFVAQLHRESLPPLPQPPTEWAVYPNPFEDHLFLWGDFVLGPLSLNLFDLSGREIWKTQMLIEDTIFPFRLSVPVLQGGFYLLRIGQGKRSVIKKMIKR
ncbi:MAG: T9SS type A sorting domain-containing protein [Bacteroidia bacterium]|nr:T9SS type A sorting domain-containing protein [Bacteroidia bacterium]